MGSTNQESNAEWKRKTRGSLKGSLISELVDLHTIYHQSNKRFRNRLGIA